MKKLFTSILVLSLAFSLFGCGEEKSAPQSDTSADNMTEAITEISTDEAIEESESTESTTETDTADSTTETDVAESATATDTAKSTKERVVLDLEDISETRENVFECTYDGVKHEFILCLPDETENAPLVVMLHGFGSSAGVFKIDTKFQDTANPAGYAVCYVTGSTLPNNAPVPGWNAEMDEEANDDVGFLIALAEYLKTEYSFDENRIYAAGFSNGAWMLHSLAMEAGSTYSAFVSVAGSMHQVVWERPNTNNDISFFQITGEKDDIVPKNSDGSANNVERPAIEDVIDYWVSSNGLSLSETDEIGVDSVSTLNKYTSDEKKNQVWHLLVKDGTHVWPTPSLNEIDTNSLILEFFESIK